eukprot:1159973-Pelagomonas_calceolata.AAC.2
MPAMNDEAGIKGHLAAHATSRKWSVAWKEQVSFQAAPAAETAIHARGHRLPLVDVFVVGPRLLHAPIAHWDPRMPIVDMFAVSCPCGRAGSKDDCHAVAECGDSLMLRRVVCH